MGAWEVPTVLGAAHGGWVRMSDFVITRDRSGREGTRRSSAWAKDYLRWAAVVDLGCATAAVFMAVQVRFGNNITDTYVALSLALPVLWIAALWLAGGYDVRFIGTGSDEFRKVLNAGVGLTAAMALFSYTINLELSRGYVVIALPSVTFFDLITQIRPFASDCTGSARSAVACSASWPWVMSRRWLTWSTSSAGTDITDWR